MDKQVLASITEHNMLKPGMGVVLGLSGGADSVALLHFLHNLPFGLKISCVHINHGLRGQESDRDAAFCTNLCKELGIDLVIFNENIATHADEAGLGTEEAGRKIRYARFAQILDQLGYDKIAVAHNKNDVAETVLLQIFRGAGGTKGISAAKGNIIRPLIGTSRKDILAYCAANNLEFCTDSTNHQNNYARNKLRNIFLPMIEQSFNPSAVDTLARLAEIAAAEDRYMDKAAENAFKKCAENGKAEIDIDLLEQYHTAIKRRVVRMVLSDVFGNLTDITYAHVDAVLSLANKESGKEITLPKNITARRQYNKICIKKPDAPTAFSVTLPKDMPIYVPRANRWFYLGSIPKYEKAFTMALDCGKISEVQIRTRLPGDKIYFSNLGTKKIKDFFIDKKIPRHMRDEAVFVACGRDIVLMLGLGLGLDDIKSEKFVPTTDADSIFLQIWEDKCYERG